MRPLRAQRQRRQEIGGGFQAKQRVRLTHVCKIERVKPIRSRVLERFALLRPVVEVQERNPIQIAPSSSSELFSCLRLGR